MLHSAVVDYGQVETAAIPRHDGGGVTVDAVEKALQDFFFVGGFVTQRPDFEIVAFATEGDGNGDDFVQVVRQKFRASFLETQVVHGFGDAVSVEVAKVAKVVEFAPAFNVGDGFDVED